MMRICAIVANASAKPGVVADIPQTLYPMLCPKETYIGIGELLAVLVGFQYFPDTLRKQSIISFVDNMGVIHSVVNGASRAIDMAAFIQALHHKIVELAVAVWWDYVPSKSNISDGGSRDGATCQMSRDAGISLREISFKLPPSSFPYVSPSEWNAWWRV